MDSSKDIFAQTLWQNNPILVQLVGILPLLMVSKTVVNAVCLGVATTFFLVASNALMSIVRKVAIYKIHLPIYIIIVVSTAILGQLFLYIHAHFLYDSFSIFTPLIVINTMIIGIFETIVRKNTFIYSPLNGLFIGLKSILVLFICGAICELLNNGTLLIGLDQIVGPSAKSLIIHIPYLHTPFVLTLIAPGTFIFLGLLIAIKNFFKQILIIKN